MCGNVNCENAVGGALVPLLLPLGSNGIGHRAGAIGNLGEGRSRVLFLAHTRRSGVGKKPGILSPDTQQKCTPASAGSSVTYRTLARDKQRSPETMGPFSVTRVLALLRQEMIRILVWPSDGISPCLVPGCKGDPSRPRSSGVIPSKLPLRSEGSGRADSCRCTKGAHPYSNCTTACVMKERKLHAV